MVKLPRGGRRFGKKEKKQNGRMEEGKNGRERGLEERRLGSTRSSRWVGGLCIVHKYEVMFFGIIGKRYGNLLSVRNPVAVRNSAALWNAVAVRYSVRNGINWINGTELGYRYGIRLKVRR